MTQVDLYKHIVGESEPNIPGEESPPSRSAVPNPKSKPIDGESVGIGLVPRSDDMRFDMRRRRANQKNDVRRTMAAMALMTLIPAIVPLGRLESPDGEEFVGVGVGSMPVTLLERSGVLMTLVDSVVSSAVVEVSPLLEDWDDSAEDEEEVVSRSSVVDVSVSVSVSGSLVVKSAKVVVVWVFLAVVVLSSKGWPPAA